MRRFLMSCLVAPLCLGSPLLAEAEEAKKETAKTGLEQDAKETTTEALWQQGEEKTGEGKDEKSPLIMCEYAYFGGMEDYSLSLTLTRQEEGCLLTSKESGWQGDRTRSANAPEEKMRELEEIVLPYEPSGWDSLPEEEYFALDAPVKSVLLVWEDGSSCSVSDDVQIDRKLFDEVRDFLEEIPLPPQKKRAR